MDYLAIKRKKRIKNTIIGVIVVALLGMGLYSYAKSETLFSDYDMTDNDIRLRSHYNSVELKVPKSVYFSKVNEAYLTHAYKLQKITVPYVLSRLFIEDCPKLHELDINNQVYSMSLIDCEGMKDINIPDLVEIRREDKNYEEMIESLNYTTSTIYIERCKGLESLSIGENHFLNFVYDCPKLSSITFSGSIYSVTIKGCDNLSKIYLPDDFTATEIKCDSSVTFVVSQGSGAEQYVIDKGLNYTY